MSSSIRRFTESEALDFIASEILFGNAAGVTRDGAKLLQYVDAGANMATFGSTVLQKRPGNLGDNFFYDEATRAGINALGIPDAGFEVHLPLLMHLRQVFEIRRAKFIVSVSAGDSFEPDEYEFMARKLLMNYAAHIVEGNFACPNIQVDGKRKPVVCFNRDDFEAGVKALRAGTELKLPIAAKIAPITEARMLEDLVEICLRHSVTYIVVANTIPNGYLEKEDGTPAIAMKRGGLSGAVLEPIVSGMITMIAPQIKGTSTKLIATGAVSSGDVAHKYLRLGAHGVSFATELYRQGGDPKVVSQIGQRLVELLVERGLPNFA
jgi:dihydroorotate dehydrogenase